MSNQLHLGTDNSGEEVNEEREKRDKRERRRDRNDVGTAEKHAAKRGRKKKHTALCVLRLVFVADQT